MTDRMPDDFLTGNEEVVDLEDLVDETAEDDGDTEEPLDEEGDSLGDDLPPDEYEGDDPAEDDEVGRRERALAERERQIAEYEAGQRQAESERFWTGKWQEGQAWFAQEERRIYQEAERAYDPAAFVRERMGKLVSQRDQWTSQYYQAREQALWQFAAQRAIPIYARQVAEHFGLPAADVKRLLKYDPEQMPQIAHDLRELRQGQRSLAARKAGGGVRPGSGKGTSGRFKAGSDRHLLALFKNAG